MVKICLWRGWVDHPDKDRKTHSRPIPNLGGIPLLLAVVFPLFLLFFWPNIPGAEIRSQVHLLTGLLLGVLPIILLGIYDDLYQADYRKKFVTQILAALIIYHFGYRIGSLSLPFGIHFELRKIRGRFSV